jgi:hypothetical protein
MEVMEQAAVREEVMQDAEKECPKTQHYIVKKNDITLECHYKAPPLI